MKCWCGTSEIVRVRPLPEGDGSYGIVSVGLDGVSCCSAKEGRFSTRGDAQACAEIVQWILHREDHK